MILSLIIVVHELGHIGMSLVFKWKIDRVLILPFGAITIFDDYLNRPLKEEWLILIFGPLTQIVFTFFLNNEKLFYYSNIILFFNLLPIFPLDGSKIVNLLFNEFISFKKSHILTLYISIITMFFTIYISSFNLVFILILLFVFFKVIDEFRNHNYIFNRFLLERYSKNFKFKKVFYINGENVSKMRRDFKHFFKGENGYVTEREVLKKRFDFKRKTW